MKSSVFLCISLACLLSATLAFGQEAPPAAPAATPPQDSTAAPTATPPQAPTAAAAPAPPKSPLTQWGTDFSFMFDGYVDANFNDPASGFNGLRNFDLRADTAHVNMGMITIDHGPAPVGFHLDVGFGETFDVIHSSSRDPEAWKYFKQAYVSLKPSHRDEPELELFTVAAVRVGDPLFALRRPRVVPGGRSFYGGRSGSERLEQHRTTQQREDGRSQWRLCVEKGHLDQQLLRGSRKA